MAEIKIISPAENLIEKIADIIMSSQDISQNIIVFPNRRPAYFLSLVLYEKMGKPFKSPECFSIDDFINDIFEKSQSNKRWKNAGQLDIISMLYEDFSEYSIEITGLKKEIFSLDLFFPWAYKIMSDFEEFKINGLKPKDIKDFDYLIRQEDEKLGGALKELDGMREKYARFSQLYERFYDKCEKEGIYTRSMKYDFVAQIASKIDFSKYENIIFAGFFALTKSEKEIFLAINSYKNARFIYTSSPLLKKYIPFKNCDIKSKEEFAENNITIRKLGGAHEEVMQLKKDLIENNIKYDKRTAIILPSSDMILPILENILSEVEKFNISAGYPLKMTPIYSMLESLFNLLSSQQVDAGQYAVSEYIAFIMHPYVKNLNVAGSSEETRKFLQELRDTLSDTPFMFRMDLESFEKISTNEAISKIHNIFIRPFEKIENISDFCDKLSNVVDFISQNSTAQRHPYWNYFPGIISEKLTEARSSKLGRVKFENKTAYFSFIKAFLSSSAHPFKGSPVEGVQCLGFLESRNLHFENIYILDVNDGILPSLKKEDTILPFAIRENLKLSTYKTTFDIYSYYFENLILSCKNAHIYYIDDKNKESSPLLEKIKWELEKKNILAEKKSLSLKINFNKHNPVEIKKTDKVKQMLAGRTFSYSTIERYLNCQLSFYYHYVLGIKQERAISDGIESRDIGELMHEILSLYFSRKIKVKFNLENKKDLEDEILEIAKSVLEKKFPLQIGLEDYMIKSQILKRAKDFIDFHLREHIDCEVLSCEKDYHSLLNIDEFKVKIMAKIDRVDKRPDGICLVDYKTSSKYEGHIPSNKISDEDLKGEILDWGVRCGSIQLPLYIMVYEDCQKTKDVFASIITLGSKNIMESPIINRNEIFDKAIKIAIADILKSDFFYPPISEKFCRFCEYKTICGRQWVKEEN